MSIVNRINDMLPAKRLAAQTEKKPSSVRKALAFRMKLGFFL